MDSSQDFFIGIIMILLFGSPIVFIAGLIVTAASKKNRLVGLYMIIGSVISFIIGFGICMNNNS